MAHGERAIWLWLNVVSGLASVIEDVGAQGIGLEVDKVLRIAAYFPLSHLSEIYRGIKPQIVSIYSSPQGGIIKLVSGGVPIEFSKMKHEGTEEPEGKAWRVGDWRDVPEYDESPGCVFPPCMHAPSMNHLSHIS